MFKKLIVILVLLITGSVATEAYAQTGLIDGIFERLSARRDAIRNLTNRELVQRQEARLLAEQALFSQKQRQQQRVQVQKVQCVQQFVVPQRTVKIVEVPKLIQQERFVVVRDSYGNIQQVKTVEQFVQKNNGQRVKVQQQIRFK